ncbi:MAG: ABC transporter substrate-binding protein [Butyribacter sp.]|nr:ABC transporter substrate-binding protein [bacterium]MDY3854987.1 ABC transporter substrate-binding protein [Butyribacter sp.]
MRKNWKKFLAVLVTCSIALGSTGCNKAKKEPKPTPKSAVKVDKGNADANGKGDGQSDIPLVVGSTKFSKQFNPFLASTQADRQVVDLTQVYLVTNDRAGRIIYKGIDGELREYNDENYTYYGATDLSVNYDKASDTTTYRIKLRDDLVFSDGEKLTINDVIFTMYVLCDEDYEGDAILKRMPIKGLTNYLADSSKAEKFSDAKVKKYIKKHRKQLKKLVKADDEYFDAEMKRQARIAMSKKKGKKVKNISGIQKVNDYEMTITTTGYCKDMTTALKIPICALHYYGDTTKFDIAKNKFGFSRGNISAILANKTNPVGAGAYRFIKCEGDVIYFNSNELYFLGCPEIAFLQLKDMTGTLKETNEEIQKKLQGEPADQTAEDQTEKESEEDKATPQPTVNPVAEVMEVTEGTVDVMGGTFTADEIPWISSVNSKNELSGDVLDTRFISDGNYHYIGMQADNVSVGNDATSNESKYLRKAFASVFSDAKNALSEKEGARVRVVNYPVAAESWVSYASDEKEYTIAYSKNVRGEKVYDKSDEAGKERTKLVSSMALEYLKEAGYQIENDKVVSAPKGASMEYTVWLADGDQNPLYPVIEAAAQTLQEMGLALKVVSVDGEKQLQQKLRTKKQQIWVGKRSAFDMNMQARYGTKDNLFGIYDDVLNGTIQDLQQHMTSAERKETYQRCFERIMDWAVEVPVCEYRQIMLYSSKRIDEDTIAEDTTLYYSWMNEIQKVCME